MVKLAQKHGMKGTKGDWKEFLNVHDKKLGASLSDPTRRSNDVLAAFLKSFAKEDDLNVIPLFGEFSFGIYIFFTTWVSCPIKTMTFMFFLVLSFLLK